MDCSLLGSSVHGISQARILEWVAICFSRVSFQPRDWTRVPCIERRIIYHWATSCCSVAKSCPILCNPMDSSTPGFPVFHNLLEFANLTSIESVKLYNHLILCCPLLPLQYFPASSSFPMSWLLVSGGENIGASASATVLPIKTQGWKLLSERECGVVWCLWVSSMAYRGQGQKVQKVMVQPINLIFRYLQNR